jgi:hypothetical protein
MKKLIIASVLLIVIIPIFILITKDEPVTPSEGLNEKYVNNTYRFSLDLPTRYSIDENYVHQITPDRNVSGVKFTIPESTKEGTNLSSDTAISVESIPNVPYCTAELFTDYPAHKPDIITENGITYSLITSSEAGAGNRYEESIYTIQDSSPCIAVRYFIHYSAFENYPTGSIKEFDKQSILNSFDGIRKSLVIAKQID